MVLSCNKMDKKTDIREDTVNNTEKAWLVAKLELKQVLVAKTITRIMTRYHVCYVRLLLYAITHKTNCWYSQTNHHFSNVRKAHLLKFKAQGNKKVLVLTDLECNCLMVVTVSGRRWV